MENQELDRLYTIVDELIRKIDLQNGLIAKLVMQSQSIPVPEKWGNIHQACELLKCSQRAVYKLVASGNIIASNVSGKRHKLYDIDSIKAYIENKSKIQIRKKI